MLGERERGGEIRSLKGEVRGRLLRPGIVPVLLLLGEEPGLFSNLLLKEDTLPVTTGLGLLLLRLSLVPVPVLPRKLRLVSCWGSGAVIESCLFLSLESKAGLGLLVLEKGVVLRVRGPVRATGSRDSALRCSNLSLVLVTLPWLALAKILLGLGLFCGAEGSWRFRLRLLGLLKLCTVLSISLMALLVSAKSLFRVPLDLSELQDSGSV